MVSCQPKGDVDSKVLSHDSSHTQQLANTENRLSQQKSLSLPLAEELTLYKQLQEFELGRFLIRNGGLNGKWTSYIIKTGLQQTNLHPLERFLLTQSPAILATRERFSIFKKETQKRLKPGMKLASIPCGLMDDLLDLDYTHVQDVSLTGIDLDPESLILAQQNATLSAFKGPVQFSQKDAWSLSENAAYDLITSNGLNIYEPDNQKVINLYKNFYNALKSGGILITSFLTPPPLMDPTSSWKNFDIAALTKQKAIFSDILQVKWQSFRTEAQTRMQLEQAGFQVLEVIYDAQGMFPTVIAKKK